MCGIAGFVSADWDASAFRDAANTVLRHRGPDDEGDLAEGRRWGLLHRRLSILDLSPLGHQPMTTPDGRYSIVFNGEIYNYVELREQLRREGRDFVSGSDTEVLLWAFATWGEACLRRFVGMFTFAVVDRVKRTMFLARDFFGIKPLYYIRPSGGFAFASEIKALRPHVSGKVRPDRLHDYLVHGLTDHGEQTLFTDIHQLPAAHSIEVDLETARVGESKRYWDIPREPAADIAFADAVTRTRELFLDSVRLHLRSDVPVGAALSGGIDSSAIVAAMRVLEPKADVRTFTFAADDPTIGEERYADLVSEHSKATALKVRLGPGDLAADLGRLIAVQDEPFGSTSIYAQYRVFRLAAENGVKVMLDGQGADEMLAGYHGYFAPRVGSLLGRCKLLSAYRFAGQASRRPGVGGRVGLLSRGAKSLLPATLQARAKSLLGRPTMPAWLDANWFESRGVVPYAGPRTSRRGDQLRDRLYHTLTHSSLPMLLRYEDRNSMAWSIESRVPFLTPSLAEHFASLPEDHLISRDGETKHVFREAMRGIVPDAILDRKDKIGFATPEQQWLKELGPWLADALRPDRLAALPMLEATTVAAEWRGVQDGTKPFDWRVWRWVNLVRWAESAQATFT